MLVVKDVTVLCLYLLFTIFMCYYIENSLIVDKAHLYGTLNLDLILIEELLKKIINKLIYELKLT